MDQNLEKMAAARCESIAAKPIHYQEFLDLVDKMLAGEAAAFWGR